MASLIKELSIEAPAEVVWGAVRDVGEVHRRLAPGFVLDTKLDGDVRVVTFANGVAARERIVSLDEGARRLAYSAVGGRAVHHHASFQVFAEGERRCRLLWVTDVLPHEMAGPIRAMVEQGAAAIKRALEASARPSAAAPPR